MAHKNIYIGGTGKTPVSIFLAKKLSEIGIKTAIMKIYYKSHLDEFKLIKNRANKIRTKNSMKNKFYLKINSILLRIKLSYS